jgi:hypothetical protein
MTVSGFGLWTNLLGPFLLQRRSFSLWASLAQSSSMSDFDPELNVRVAGNDIIVTLVGTQYSVTYFKRKGSPGLFAKDMNFKDDPRLPLTSAEFLAKAWKAANDKARELGW